MVLSNRSPDDKLLIVTEGANPSANPREFFSTEIVAAGLHVARIEALKVIEVAEGRAPESEFAVALTKILSGCEDDDDVCNLAAMAAASFLKNESLFQQILAIAL